MYVCVCVRARVSIIRMCRVCSVCAGCEISVFWSVAVIILLAVCKRGGVHRDGHVCVYILVPTGDEMMSIYPPECRSFVQVLFYIRTHNLCVCVCACLCVRERTQQFYFKSHLARACALIVSNKLSLALALGDTRLPYRSSPTVVPHKRSAWQLLQCLRYPLAYNFPEEFTQLGVDMLVSLKKGRNESGWAAFHTLLGNHGQHMCTLLKAVEESQGRRGNTSVTAYLGPKHPAKLVDLCLECLRLRVQLIRLWSKNLLSV